MEQEKRERLLTEIHLGGLVGDVFPICSDPSFVFSKELSVHF